mgnify:CR=1 FL=1
MDGLAKVPPLLLVPPVGMGVAELALDAGRVDVAAVLREIVSSGCSAARSQNTSTHHVGVLLVCESRIVGVGVLLVDLAPADHGLGQECSLLDQRETPRRGEHRRAQGRHRPHESARQHLHRC